MLLDDLVKQKLLKPGSDMPKWLNNNTQYLTIMGSVAYGVSNDMSDVDVYGFAIPPKDMIFPHLEGHIHGFGPSPQSFEQWQMHHLRVSPEREYDLTVYGIVKFFHLVAGCNPNMIDALYSPARCVLHATKVAQMVRENRKLFLHKGAWHTFKGYAFSNLSKIETKKRENERVHSVRAFEIEHDIPRTTTIDDIRNSRVANLTEAERAEYLRLYEDMLAESKRLDGVKRFSFDVKYAYHVTRLMSEVEQILIENDLDLERNREQLKAIRRGEVSLEDIRKEFSEKQIALETVYANSKLPHSPDYARIRGLLIDCLEHHYGSLAGAVQKSASNAAMIRDIETILEKYRQA